MANMYFAIKYFSLVIATEAQLSGVLLSGSVVGNVKIREESEINCFFPSLSLSSFMLLIPMA